MDCDGTPFSLSSLFECAISVLNTASVPTKATLTHKFAAHWSKGDLPLWSRRIDDVDTVGCTTLVPDHPARSVPTSSMPPPMRREGSKKVVKFIHGLCHAEGVAIDLMWDLIARSILLWGRSIVGSLDDAKKGRELDHHRMDLGEFPREFYDDWVGIADEEARHFESWAERFEQVSGGAKYGCFQMHDGLWNSAVETSSDILARLAIVHGVHEARGLDVFPKAEVRFLESCDPVSVDLLRRNLKDEIRHVGTAIRWLTFLCESRGLDPVTTFHRLVRQHFHGPLPGPFNAEARTLAGMTPEWYQPLA
uniref:Ferritin-like domain-containing protein n=1 Tax=Compsopogon caeruleus TaxID=31354 RepID=A0A6T6ASI4_9RHOD|mmetsp:Transcript_11136/g.22175  ORF Transcript_11136/g.22175 Transcript_11136/m.22175 type:complete len:307 (+) Transcript_11136:398-1318(+)|eukprot:CAMPEP_0184685590 /NCGR_PEP_ID=MMETSP0312-20130426/19482_1 /TAXON_ID=31354 /ORGANISM="Compsopogon coeruleus, Strain SAG 36.94" /LENGTH=306 /DNA_ID=CAMNT_0027139811 /DNA_START=372 /DNA_END=1292 /DNA_ORIENTATION=+